MKTVINAGSFIVMIILCRLWIEYDQALLPAPLLMPAFLIVLLILMSAYFYIVKPLHVRRFALYLSFIVCAIAITLSLVQHGIMQHDFGLYWKHLLIIWSFSFVVPNIIGFAYYFISRILKRNANTVGLN
jgi:hypothetical protein